ncbi:hypothetical protein SBV1_1100009 [Verrucomicrobia bacterium]|nr:hypothetical protein SBV1_1100009 [Verrucomicrobiota bacterium]
MNNDLPSASIFGTLTFELLYHESLVLPVNLRDPRPGDAGLRSVNAGAFAGGRDRRYPEGWEEYPRPDWGRSGADARTKPRRCAVDL